MFSFCKEKQEKIGFKRRNGFSSRFVRSWLIVWVIFLTIGTIILYLQDHKGNTVPHSLQRFAKDLNLHAKSTKESESGTRNFCELIHIGVVAAGYKSNVYFHTLLKSLYLTRSNPLHFHLLVTNESDTVLRSLFNTWKIPQVNVTFYNLNPWLKHVRWVPNGHYSGNYGLLKLIFNKVIPSSVTTKLLVLDTDIIVNDDIYYLWKFFDKFNQKQAIGISENQSPYYTGQLQNQARPWPAIGIGFNSGVMLYDLEKLNIRQWDDTWVNLTKRYTLIYGETDLGDQDIINSVLVENPGMVYKLPCYWNTQMSGYSTSSTCYSKHKPKILHWNSPHKFSVATKDGDLFRGVANMIFEVNGNWFRNFPKLCQNDFHISFNMQQDECKKCIKSPDTTYRTLLFFMDHKFVSDNWDITWVTHLSYDRMSLMEIIAKHWTGPISFTLYLTDEELVKTMKLISESDVLSRRNDVAYHAVFKQEEFYPINVLRNTGLKHVQTPYSFLVDADFRPMKSLYEILKDNIRSMGELTKKALVIPAFEATKPNVELPESKIQLLESVRKKEVQQFLVETWSAGHGATDYNKWVEEYEPYKVKWQSHYEPYIVVKSDVVPYDERFLGFGWNKVSHIMELEAQNYEFIVLSDVFVLHEPHGPSFDIKQYQKSSVYRKCVQTLKRRFIHELSKKYNRNFTDPTSDYLRRKKRDSEIDITTTLYDSTDHFLAWGGKEKLEMQKEMRKKHFNKEKETSVDDYVYYDDSANLTSIHGTDEKLKNHVVPSSEEHDYEYNEEEHKFRLSHDSTTVTFNDSVTILTDEDLVSHESDESESAVKVNQ